MADEVKIGMVSHYFGKIQVAAIELTEGGLAVGDTIHIKGHTSDFTQAVDSMQIDNASVDNAEKGQSVGIRVSEHARVGDDVFKVVD
jgi:putative protease